MNGLSTSCVWPKIEQCPMPSKRWYSAVGHSADHLFVVLGHRLHVLVEGDHVQRHACSRGSRAVWSNSTQGSHCAISDASLVSVS